MPPRIIGKIVYTLAYPAIKLIVRNSRRAYVMVVVGDEALVTKDWLGNMNDWRLPGGGVKKNETPMQAVIRECREEVGVDLREPELMKIVGKKRSRLKFDYWVYVVDLHTKPMIEKSRREISETQWISVNELSNHPCSEELTSGLGAM